MRDHAGDMSRHQDEEHEDERLMDLLGAVADAVGRDPGERPQLLLAADDEQPGRGRGDQHGEQEVDHDRAGRVVADVMAGPQEQQAADVLPDIAGTIGEAGDAAVLRPEDRPDQPHHQQRHDGVAGPEVHAQPPLRRDEAGEEVHGDQDDQKPVEQAGRQIPDPDRPLLDLHAHGIRRTAAIPRRQLGSGKHL